MNNWRQILSWDLPETISLEEFLEKTYKIEGAFGQHYQKVRPRIVCGDGFSLSVQGGDYLYSLPRTNGWAFSAVEVGYPSEAEEELKRYADNLESFPDTIYGYVPIEIVRKIIDKHGGIVKEMTFV